MTFAIEWNIASRGLLAISLSCRERHPDGNGGRATPSLFALDAGTGYRREVEHEFVDGRLYLRRSADERSPILRRLKKIEGQVRGLQQMLEQDRYCLEELQQANAVIAAMREVALLIASQHLAAGVDHVASDGPQEGLMDEMKAVLRASMRNG